MVVKAQFILHQIGALVMVGLYLLYSRSVPEAALDPILGIASIFVLIATSSDDEFFNSLVPVLLSWNALSIGKIFSICIPTQSVGTNHTPTPDFDKLNLKASAGFALLCFSLFNALHKPVERTNTNNISIRIFYRYIYRY